MAKAKHTYAVRLAVEGGNKVKANLTSVGTSGERSMRRIDRGSDRASRGLGTLGDRASSLRRNMRLLGGVVAGVAAAGGLALLVKRSIDAADAIAKTADAIGISTDALQELRFALGISGVATEQTDKGLKKFTRNMGELARSSSETQTTLKDLDPTLLSNLRSLNSVEDQLQISFRALASYTDQTKRGAVAQSLFGRSALVMTVGVKNGIEAFEALRQQARDLGIVLDEELLRSAEKTKDQLTVLGTVLSANLNKAVLEHADAIGDLAERFTESLPTLISWVSTFGQWIGLIEESPAKRLAEIREEIAVLEEVLQKSQGVRGSSQWLNDLFGMGPIPRGVVETRFEELRAEAAELERQLAEAAVKPPPSVTPTATPAAIPAAGDPGRPCYDGRTTSAASGADREEPEHPAVPAAPSGRRAHPGRAPEAGD